MLLWYGPTARNTASGEPEFVIGDGRSTASHARQSHLWCLRLDDDRDVRTETNNRGGLVTPRVHSGLTYPTARARLRPPLGRAGGSLGFGGFAPASHEAVRLSGAVGEGPLRTPAYLRGCGVTFLTVGAALRVGLWAPSPRRSAGWRGVAPAPPLGSWGWGRPFG